MSALQAINLESLQLAKEVQKKLAEQAESVAATTRLTATRNSRYELYDLADNSGKKGGSNLDLAVARLDSYQRKAACKGRLSKRHLVQKRAITASLFSTNSPECPALHVGTEKLRPHTNLCREMQRGLYFSHDTNKLSFLDKRDYPLEHFVCEHFVELDSIERAYRGELRILVNNLLSSKETNSIGHALCKLYSENFAAPFKEAANSPENLALVSHNLEKPKSVALRGIYSDQTPFADGLLTAYSNSISPSPPRHKSQLNSFHILQQSDSDSEQEVDAVKTIIPKSGNLDASRLYIESLKTKHISLASRFSHLFSSLSSAFSFLMPLPHDVHQNNVHAELERIRISGAQFLESRVPLMLASLQVIQDDFKRLADNEIELSREYRIPTTSISTLRC